MKHKKALVITILIVLLLAILTFPVKLQFKDGGSVSWTALTYRVVKWYDFKTDSFETKVYFIPDNFKNINELRDEFFKE